MKIGQKLAHFEIQKKLGQGGMGTVYLARDERLGRQVALKLLPEELLGDEERRARFEREARTAARVQHANVMGIFDLGEADDPETGRRVSYIVMEHVDGEPLHEYLKTHPLGMTDVLRIGERIAAGLAAAHKLGIVHRDIKPENVMIDAEGEPKILDFGLAKPTESAFRTDEPGPDVTREMSTALTQVGRIVGTVQYMSPEQAQGGEVDPRSDIFSFGVLLYRLATGETPFAGPTQVSTLAKIIEGRHEPPRTRNEAIPSDLERIIDRCLQKDPAARYQDTAELVSDLRSVRRRLDSGISESAISATGMSAARGSRRTWIVPAVLVVLLAAAGGFLWPRIFHARGGGAVGRTDGGLAVLSFENRTQDADLDWLETGLPEILLTDLAGVEGLSLISRERVSDYLRREGAQGIEEAGQAEARKAARKLGAKTALTGSVIRLGGEQLRIDARLEDLASGKIVLAEKVQGTDPMVMVDSLTARVTQALHVTSTPVSEPGAAEAMTASVEAFKHNHIGEEKFSLGLRDEAREEFLKAIAADSLYAPPYINLATSYYFEMRPQKGETYLRRAIRLKDRLPPEGRAFLDVLEDLWINHQFADGFAKLEGLVSAYPDDKKAATVFGVLLTQFDADTTRAFAEFDRVLAQDPGYAFALGQYAEALWQFDQRDRAVEMMQRFKRFHPDSPLPYARLGAYYSQMGRLEDALGSFEEHRRRFPEDPSVLGEMGDLAIRTRDFKRARMLLDEIPRLRPDDPLALIRYHGEVANLDLWEGKFLGGLEEAGKALAVAKEMNDSLQVISALQSLGTYYFLADKHAEALVAYREANDLQPVYNRIGFPFSLLQNDPDAGAEALRSFAEASEAFKERTPRDLWPIVDNLGDALKAQVDRDTTAWIAAMQVIVDWPANRGGRGNRREFGELLTDAGQYERALPYLEPFISGDEESAGAYSYLKSSWLVGRCYQGLGRTGEAREKYEEVLRFWGNADVPVEAADDSRRRLEKLTS